VKEKSPQSDCPLVDGFKFKIVEFIVVILLKQKDFISSSLSLSILGLPNDSCCGMFFYN